MLGLQFFCSRGGTAVLRPSTGHTVSTLAEEQTRKTKIVITLQIPLFGAHNNINTENPQLKHQHQRQQKQEDLLEKKVK